MIRGTNREFQWSPGLLHPFVLSLFCLFHPHKHKGLVQLTEIPPLSTEEGTTDRKMLHFCPQKSCAGVDPENFRLNRKEVNDMDFLDKSKIYSYRTIDSRETIRNPIRTFCEFSQYVRLMANRKSCGKDQMPADLFKKNSTRGLPETCLDTDKSRSRRALCLQQRAT